jgi:hypothetical protein
MKAQIAFDHEQQQQQQQQQRNLTQMVIFW